MKRKEYFQLLNKLNILKGYLLDDNINSNEILNVANSLLSTHDKKELIQKIEEEKFTDALNLLNNYKLEISNSIFENPCDKSWYTLTSTEVSTTKFCLDCRKNVYLVSNEDELIKRKNLQQCVALNIHYFTPDEKLESNFKSCRIKFFDNPEYDEYEVGFPY